MLFLEETQKKVEGGVLKATAGLWVKRVGEWVKEVRRDLTERQHSYAEMVLIGLW